MKDKISNQNAKKQNSMQLKIRIRLNFQDFEKESKNGFPKKEKIIK